MCLFFRIILYVNRFDKTVLYMCIEYHIYDNMYYVSAQGVDEHTINVHYYSYKKQQPVGSSACSAFQLMLTLSMLRPLQHRQPTQ